MLSMIITNGVKYIGSKNKLNDFIIQMINDHCGKINSAIDVFTGTTRVAQAIRQNKILTYTSDLSWASKSYANTFVHNHSNLHLHSIIKELNELKGVEGWLTNHYCDVKSNGNIVRVWQRKNGMRADAIRNKIEELNILEWEKDTLITSLIMALDAVDNTIGIQQAYLKDWCTRSYKDLQLKLPPMIWNPLYDDPLPIAKHFSGDALEIDYPSVDLSYLDPPYSPHSYATYYHIWDSIVKWDKPEVGLKTNRRIDRVAKSSNYNSNMESQWNRKNKALNAFNNLIDRLNSKYIIISYNDESLVKKNDLISLCKSKGEVLLKEIDYTRNIMRKIGNMSEGKKEKEKNQELLILVQKT